MDTVLSHKLYIHTSHGGLGEYTNVCLIHSRANVSLIVFARTLRGNNDMPWSRPSQPAANKPSHIAPVC